MQVLFIISFVQIYFVCFFQKFILRGLPYITSAKELGVWVGLENGNYFFIISFVHTYLTYYVDQIFLNFDPLPSLSGQTWTFYILSALCHVTIYGFSTDTLPPSSCPCSYWMPPNDVWPFLAIFYLLSFSYILWSLMTSHISRALLTYLLIPITFTFSNWRNIFLSGFST